MGLMDFEARGNQGHGYPLGVVLDVRRTTRTRVPADDEATKKGTNPNSGGSDERRNKNKKDDKTETEERRIYEGPAQNLCCF